MLKRLLRSHGAQGAVGRLAALYVRLVFRTTRWRLSGAEFLLPALRHGPFIVAFWHEHQVLMPMLSVMARRAGSATPVSVLVSRHRDGRLNGVILTHLGLRPLYGSTSHGGGASFRQMLAALEGGGIVAITPDGPHGPAHRAAQGVARLAAASGVPVLPCAARSSRARRLHTWDRMIVPFPFGRGVLVCRPTIEVPAGAWEGAIEPIARAMTEAAETAERMCTS